MRPLFFALVTNLLCAQSPPDPARVQVFEVIPMTVKVGEPVELRWSATGAEWIRLEPLDKNFPPGGQVTYVIKERTVFWIHVSNMSGGQSVPLVVEIIPQDPQSPSAQQGADGNSRTPVAVPPPGGIWIQFAALADTENAERLRKELTRLTGSEVLRFDIDDPGHPGQTLQRLRMGPFSSVRAARKRLGNLHFKLRDLHLKPIVAVN